MTTADVAALPALPDGQRWNVSVAFFFLTVKLQERRWWGWRTIASSTGNADMGRHAVDQCVDHILRRDYFNRLRAEESARLAARRTEIPHGVTGDIGEGIAGGVAYAMFFFAGLGLVAIVLLLIFG